MTTLFVGTGNRKKLDELRRRLERELRALAACNDPQGVYARLPFTLSIR